MIDWREQLEFIRTSRVFRRYLVLFLIVIGIIWFIPPVWRLKDNSIEVTRWIKSKGRVTAKVGPREKGWTAYNRISRHTFNAVICAEDGKFYTHHGLDLASIADSFEENMKKGKYVRGGSTITQQLIKMAFLSRDKNILRKAREAVGALLVEMILDKKQILEWYLNMVEFGDGIYGLDAAARNYFGSKPEMLTAAQSIHLALVLPSPNRWSAGLRKRELTPFGHRRFAAIVSNMYKGGYITKEQWIGALAGGNFGAPINGFQSVVAQYESQNQPQITDPRAVAPQSGEPEEITDGEMDDEAPIPDSAELNDLSSSVPSDIASSPAAIETPVESPTLDPAAEANEVPQAEPSVDSAQPPSVPVDEGSVQ